MKMQKNEKSNYVVWPARLSKFLKIARGPKSLTTPALYDCEQTIGHGKNNGGSKMVQG